MFTINNLSKTYGNDYIIINGKIVINTHDKCALVGKNGSGKTTIMNIINGNTDYEGNLEKNDITICKFNQIEEIQDTAQNYLIDYQNYDYEKENIIHQLIDMFELDSNILLKQFNTLSGGQKSIIRLIKTLSSKSDLLLLDEPTNHLDFKSINILINWLKKFEKSYVIISHDRFFLNEISNKVIEIENKLINSYNCNYDEYIKRKKKRIENEEENYQKNIKEKKRLNTIKQEQDKFKNKLNTKLSKLKLIHGPNKAAACSARQKGEKSQIRYGKNISVTDQKIENLNLIKPNIDNNRLRIELFQTNKSNYEVIELDECSKSIEDNLILNKINLEILRNDKIFISGNSGSGKTTLINSIINKKFDNGNLKLGDNIIIGQISQEKFHLQKEIKIIDYFKKKYSKIDLGIMRNYLAAFLFKKNEINKKLNELSGGELMRIDLLDCLIKGSNLLIFDEPTNNLDLESIEALEKAIIEFEGTIIVISHDKKLIENCANKKYELKCGKLIKKVTF